MRTEDFTKDAPGFLVGIQGEPDTVRAFVPHPIPQHLTLTSRIARLNEEAGILLGEIRAKGDVLSPSVELYLRKEALASNKIEGTISTAKDLYLMEVSPAKELSSSSQRDTREVLNYVNAMKSGVQLLRERPMSINTILKLHSILLANVRGHDKAPGIIRNHQNAIAFPSKPNLVDARFIPPPAQYVRDSMNDLEKFVHAESEMPDLVRAALFHYQFETIHPFSDGNGRLGRLLVPLLLIQWGKLPQSLPRLYLSPNLAEKDEEYRERLLLVSQKGDWIGWIEFFLNVIIDEGHRVCEKVLELERLKEDYLSRILGDPGKLRAVVEKLFMNPVIGTKSIETAASVSPATALNYAKRLIDRNILIADTTEYRNVYYAPEIFRIFFEEHVEP